MQNSVNHRNFERNWRFQVPPGSMSLRVAPPPASARLARAGLGRRAGRLPLPLGASVRPVPRRPKCVTCFAPVVFRPRAVSRRASAASLRLLSLRWRVPGWTPVVCSTCGRSGVRVSVRVRRHPDRGGCFRTAPCFEPRHRMRQDYPLNLSISLSGGEETNQDAPSNGE